MAKAQASGLPSTLTRTENQTIIDSNRNQACGSAPSVPNKSCGEYPIATSHQGLNVGGTRRTQPGCGFSGVPAATGPAGVSVCMIVATENSSQGGTNTQFSGVNESLKTSRSTLSSVEARQASRRLAAALLPEDRHS
ncbi:hypothetical protein [Streptomyces sp. NPDC060031]|uniref:hypothetical protein n=1 Tax=Streptomyces sp. NPDC060031 TaxID=3347043 RepID=UPI0036A50BD9